MMDKILYVYEVNYAKTLEDEDVWEVTHLVGSCAKDITEYCESLGLVVKALTSLGRITEDQILI